MWIHLCFIVRLRYLNGCRSSENGPPRFSANVFQRFAVYSRSANTSNETRAGKKLGHAVICATALHIVVTDRRRNTRPYALCTAAQTPCHAQSQTTHRPTAPCTEVNVQIIIPVPEYTGSAVHSVLCGPLAYSYSESGYNYDSTTRRPTLRP